MMMSLVYFVLHPSGICRRIYRKKRTPIVPHQENPPTPACAVRRARGMGPSIKEKRKERKERYTMPYWATLSSASHAIHPSILAARVSSTPSPSTNLPTPDNSRKRSKRLSHGGLLRSTRMLPGSLPSHASARVARNLSFVQSSKVCDLVIFRSRQN